MARRRSNNLIDNAGGYSPENCRWATRTIQNNNTRRNVFLEINGVVKTVSQWARAVGVNRRTIEARVRSGYSPIVAVFTPPGKLGGVS